MDCSQLRKISNGRKNGISTIRTQASLFHPYTHYQLISIQNLGSFEIIRFRYIDADRALCYLAVLDSDDWWDTDYLERLLFWSEKNKLDVASHQTLMDHIDKRRTSRESDSDEAPSYQPQFFLSDGGAGNTIAFLV